MVFIENMSRQGIEFSETMKSLSEEKFMTLQTYIVN